MKCEACDQPYSYYVSSDINHRLCVDCQINAVVWAAKRAWREQIELALVEAYCKALREAASTPVIALDNGAKIIAPADPFMTGQRDW